MTFNRSGKIFTVIMVLILISSVLFTVSFTNSKAIENIKITWSTENKHEELSLFHSEGIYYAFLPSYVDPENTKMETDISNKIYIDGIKSELIEFELDRIYNLTVKNLIGLTVCEEKIKFIKSANIATLSLQLNNGSIEEINNNKELKKSGNIQFINSQAEVQFSGSFKAMHGRGNSSWLKEKKPYIIEFDNPVNLGGLGEMQEYCLIASANEPSCLRNKIAYDLADKIGLKYSPKSVFVDLYIDGNYYGLYLLVEKIKVSPAQINIVDLENITQELNQFKLDKYPVYNIVTPSNEITKKAFSIPKNPADISGGYLVELEYYGRVQSENSFFTTESGLTFNVKYPDACSAEQINYISNYFQQIENSFSTQNFDEYIDTHSWAEYYLIHEFLANQDKVSYYFYKDSDANDPKVYAGPVWDFDLSLGLQPYNNGNVKASANPYQYYVNNWKLFENLYKQPQFKSLLKDIYTTEFRDVIFKLINTDLDNYHKLIEKSWIMNQLRWQHTQLVEISDSWISLQHNIDFLRSFMNNRLNCFDSNLIKNEPLVKITLKSDTAFIKNDYYYIAYNSCIGDIGTLPSDEYVFSGWHDKLGNPLDASAKITEDTEYYAIWQKSASAPPSQETASPDLHSYINFYFSLASFALICIIILAITLKSIIGKKGEQHEK